VSAFRTRLIITSDRMTELKLVGKLLLIKPFISFFHELPPRYILLKLYKIQTNFKKEYFESRVQAFCFETVTPQHF